MTNATRLLLFLLAALAAACSKTGNSDTSGAGLPEWARAVVDSTNAGDCKAIGDVDGDGRPDVVVGGATLAWYRNPDWHKTTIASAAVEFTTDCQAADLTGDGRIDIVTADGAGSGNVVWFENPSGGGSWIRRRIGTHGNWAHDIEVADFDADGKLDVVTHGHGTHVWYQGSQATWTDRDLSSLARTREGLGIGDIDGDGHLDLVQGGWWLKNPGTRSDPWPAYRFAGGYDGGDHTAAVADLDGDGRKDIVVANQHARRELAWYAAPADPRQPDWTKNVIANDIGAHKLNVADLNRDGKPDLVVGLELAELRVYVNRGGASPRFVSRRLNSTGCHNTRVGDLNGDGYVDLLCVNYIEHPPVEIWLSKPPAPLALDRWRYIKVDATRAKMASSQPAFGLAFGDVDRDGRIDIVSGKYFYRNPGGDLAGSWSRTTFPVDADAMLVVDVDGDGQKDVIAQALPAVYWLKPDADASRWSYREIARLTPTGHVNSQGYRPARITPDSPRPEIVFTTGDGVWYIGIPDDPTTVAWPTVKVASDTSEDLLAVGDIDGDGLDDVVASDAGNGKTIYWFRNPGNGAGDWTRRTVGEVADWADRAEIVDVDGDGRRDVVVAVENGAASSAVTYLFRSPRDPRTQQWSRRAIANQGSTNAMSVGDVDADGRIDIVTGEHKGLLRIRIWKSSDGGHTWTDTVVDSGKESHLGARLVDLDGDGALDIVSIAYDAFHDLHLWRNDAKR